MLKNLKKNVATYGLSGTLVKGLLTPEAQTICMPSFEKKQFEKIAKKEEKKKQKKKKEGDLSELALYLEEQDGIEREVINYNDEEFIAKVASREELYDSNLKKYSVKLKPHDFIRKDFNKLVVYIKVKNSYARIFKAKRIDENQLLVDLNENKGNISDYVILR